MKSYILVIFGLILIACKSAAPPEPAVVKTLEDEKGIHELTQELMIKSGLNDQIESVPEKTRVEIMEVFKRNEALTVKITDKVAEEVRDFIIHSHNPDSIRTIISGYIEAQLDPKDIRNILKWLDSPLGKKITEVEKISSTPEAYKEMIATVQNLKMTPDYEERLSLIHEIDKTVKVTELIVNRSLDMQVITLSAAAKEFPALNIPSEDVIRSRFEENRVLITEAISKEITMSILFAYRNISKDDIKAYIRFIKSDYGKRYHEVIQEATTKAYAYCGKKYSEAVVTRITGRTGKPANSDTDILNPPKKYPQERKR